MGRASSTFPQKSQRWSPVIISILKGIPLYVRIHFPYKVLTGGDNAVVRFAAGNVRQVHIHLLGAASSAEIREYLQCKASRALAEYDSMYGATRLGQCSTSRNGTRATSDPISGLLDNGTAVTPTRNCFSASAALRHSIFPMHLIAFFRTCPYLDNPVPEVAQCCDRLRPCMK